MLTGISHVGSARTRSERQQSPHANKAARNLPVCYGSRRGPPGGRSRGFRRLSWREDHFAGVHQGAAELAIGLDDDLLLAGRQLDLANGRPTILTARPPSTAMILGGRLEFLQSPQESIYRSGQGGCKQLPESRRECVAHTPVSVGSLEGEGIGVPTGRSRAALLVW